MPDNERERIGFIGAGLMGRGGEIFVLDMGAPVKIDTLARNLIRMSGHKPDVDIKIVYTGEWDIIGTTRENSSIYAACVA